MRYLFYAILLGTFYSDAYEQAIKKVVSEYKRSFTVLEIGTDTPKFLFSLGSRRGTGIALQVGSDPNHITSTSSGITVLAPRKLTCSQLEALGRCEHFDLVIVHDISSLIQAPLSRLVAALIALGDFVFLETDSLEYESVIRRSKKIIQVVPRTETGGPLFLSDRKKTSLSLARFTQERSYKEPNYEVTSTFHKKEFFKKGLAYPLRWVQGINLVSFVMLSGVHPTDLMIRKRLRLLKKLYPSHADLVLGNLIVKGDTLIPIDSQDSRRNADPHACISCALKVFKKGNTRLSDPQGWIDDYYTQIMKNARG